MSIRSRLHIARGNISIQIAQCVLPIARAFQSVHITKNIHFENEWFEQYFFRKRKDVLTKI